METPVSDFNIDLVKQYIENPPTEGDGWKLEFEGLIHENASDKNTVKVYRKPASDDSEIQMNIKAVLSGVKACNIFKILKEPEFREKIGRPPKIFEIVEQTSDNSDVIYLEIDLPSPLINRDFVQKRLYLGNKEDPELIELLNLYKSEHSYYLIVTESTERPEYPEKDKPVRGDTLINYTLIEEDPKEEGLVNINLVFHQKLNGNVPKGVLGKAASQMPCKMMGALLECHKKFFEIDEIQRIQKIENIEDKIVAE